MKMMSYILCLIVLGGQFGLRGLYKKVTLGPFLFY